MKKLSNTEAELKKSVYEKKSLWKEKRVLKGIQDLIWAFIVKRNLSKCLTKQILWKCWGIRG